MSFERLTSCGSPARHAPEKSNALATTVSRTSFGKAARLGVIERHGRGSMATWSSLMEDTSRKYRGLASSFVSRRSTPVTRAWIFLPPFRARV
jgi:hypothetical protein